MKDHQRSSLTGTPTEDDSKDYPSFDANTMSRLLKAGSRDFESAMDELEDAFGTIRKIWGQRESQDVAYVRPDGVLVDHDGVELRKATCYIHLRSYERLERIEGEGEGREGCEWARLRECKLISKWSRPMFR